MRASKRHGQIERIDQVVESESNLKIKRMKCGNGRSY